jgi:hypothetical protein
MVAYSEEWAGATRREIEHRGRRYPWSLRGYRRSAVDQHIAELECELRELDCELAELRAAGTLREEVANEMRRICEETARVLVEAHNEREAITRAAQEQAHQLVADATSRATAITSESEDRAQVLGAQLEAVQQDRDRLLENALAASAAIADVVHGARQQVPPTAAAELTALEDASDQGIDPEVSVGEPGSYVG